MLSNHLGLGADAARTKRQLAVRLYGCTCRSDTCTHKRDVEEEIRRLIVSEHLWIVADGRGYWLTENEAEVERYIASLEGRRDSLTERVMALRAAVAGRKADGEQTTWLDAA